MRVLFTCVPQSGHVTPLLPLAEAFRQRGDEVLLASGPDVADTAATLGLAFRQVGPSFDEWFSGLLQRTRGRPGEGLPPERVAHYFMPRLFGEVGAALVLDDLMTIARESTPDLLVFDTLMLAGPMVAAAQGIHGVQHALGPMVDRDVLELVADAVSPMWRELGLAAPRDAGTEAGTTLAICPSSLDPAAVTVPGLQLLRPVPLPRGPAADPARPALLAGLPDHPLVYVTLGTFSNTDLDLFRLLFRALAALPVAVVATVGRDNDPADLAPLPSNVRVERFVPQADLLPHCTLVVHHAGAGTTFGALAHGLPAVAVPRSADNFTIAQRLADAGAARTLMPDEVSAASVRRAVEDVLADAAFAERAASLAGEIAAMPAPDEVAARLAESAGQLRAAGLPS